MEEKKLTKLLFAFSFTLVFLISGYIEENGPKMLVVGHHIIEAPPQFANENTGGGTSPGSGPGHSPTASSPGSPGVEVIKIQQVGKLSHSGW